MAKEINLEAFQQMGVFMVGACSLTPTVTGSDGEGAAGGGDSDEISDSDESEYHPESSNDYLDFRSWLPDLTGDPVTDELTNMAALFLQFGVILPDFS